MITLNSRFQFVGSLALVLLFANIALAQEPAHSLNALQPGIKLGDRLNVVDLSGKKTAGRFDGVSGFSLRLIVNGNQRELPESTLRDITLRRPDRVWDGALFGAGIGAITGVIVGNSLGDCGGDGDCRGLFVLASTGIGTATGALLDFLRQKHEKVFARLASTTALHVSPIVSNQRKGAMVSLSFGPSR